MGQLRLTRIFQDLLIYLDIYARSADLIRIPGSDLGRHRLHMFALLFSFSLTDAPVGTQRWGDGNASLFVPVGAAHGKTVLIVCFWWRFTAAKFTIRNFYNPSSQNCKPNNFLKSSSILTLMSLNSAFKHVSLLHSDNYKERPNIQNKENFKLLKK